MEKHYTEEDLDEMASEKVTYNNKELSRYEGEQKLREIERNIRHYKRRALTQEAMGTDSTLARRKIGEWQAKAREFTKQTGIARDSAREYIGTPNGKQPRGISTAIAGYSDNLKKAQEIKSLDNARKKIIANIEQGKPMNFQQANGGAPNPNYRKGGGYERNCQSCVVAYELRRRGYDVETLPNSKGSMLEVLSHNTSLAWVDRKTGKPPEYITPFQRTGEKLLSWLKENIKPRNRYTMEFGWKGKQSDGHIVHLFKNDKGVLSIYDPQTGINIRGDKEVLAYFEKVKLLTIKLLDVQNYDINMNVVNKILQGVKR